MEQDLSRNHGVCAVSVGVDVSKKTLDICIKYPDGQYSSLTIDNTLKGVGQLMKDLEVSNVSRSTPIVCEATGGYHFALCLNLKADGYLIKVINPFILNSFARMEIRKTKTDRIDARRLSDLGHIHTNLPTFTASSDSITLKKLSSLKNTYTKINQKLSCTQKTLEDTHLEGLIDLDIQITLVKETRRQIQKTIRTIEKLMRESDVSKKVIETTGKIQGVSNESITSIIAEVGDMHRFKNKRQLVAFCGLDPSIKQSGTSIHGRSKLSKRGSPIIRNILYQAAWGLKTYDIASKTYYEKKKLEGKHYFTCLIAIARKFIIRLWSAIRKGERYIPASIQIS